MTHDSANDNRIASDAKPQASKSDPPRYEFAELSQGGREVHIEHEGYVYRLRLTRNAKLILTK